MNHGNDPEVEARCRDYDPNILGFMPAPDTTVEYQQLLLALGCSTLNQHEKIAAIYNYVDLFLAFYEDKTVCQVGCAHCCRHPVLIHKIEAEYIAYKTGIPCKLNSYTPTYCSLLNKSNGQCSVYNFRPLVCRSFMTFDHPKYCEEGDVIHAVTTVGSSKRLIELKMAIYILSGKDDEKDIRHYFPSHEAT